MLRINYKALCSLEYNKDDLKRQWKKRKKKRKKESQE